LTSDHAHELERCSSMNRDKETEMTKFDEKKISTGSILMKEHRIDSRDVCSAVSGGNGLMR